jgi:hypothetical protein
MPENLAQAGGKTRYSARRPRSDLAAISFGHFIADRIRRTKVRVQSRALRAVGGILRVPDTTGLYADSSMVVR